MDNTDIESLIRAQIEVPAARQIQSLLADGMITSEDAELFRVSARRFKAAALAEYDGFDPAVRHLLVRALLTNYQLEVGRLLRDISGRSAEPARSSRAGADAPPNIVPSDRETPAAPNHRRSFRKFVATILRGGSAGRADEA